MGPKHTPFGGLETGPCRFLHTRIPNIWEYPPPHPPIASTVLNNRKATIGANWVGTRKRAPHPQKMFIFYEFYEKRLTITPQGGWGVPIFSDGGGGGGGVRKCFLVQTLGLITDAEIIDP